MPVDPSETFARQAGAFVDSDDSVDRKSAEQIAAEIPLFNDIGEQGLKRSGGWVDEEFLPQLRGRKAVQVFKEMSENDPIVGALLYSINMLLRNVKWTVKPGGDKRQDRKAADLVETCMSDMEHTWDEFISEALSMLVFGWSWHEIVYKKREGIYSQDRRRRSKYDDGMIGWRKMPIRAQETLFKWVFDEDGDVEGLVQMPPPKYRQILVPRSRSMLFRFQQSKGNPEGKSLLRNAYRPWYYLKRIQEFEAVGIERDLAGLPMVKVPAEWMSAKPGSPQHKAVLEFKRMVKSVRRDEQEGVVFPISYDQDTKQPLFEFELLGSGGGRQFGTDSVIQRYEQRVLMSVLADFIMVGHQGTGSYSMHVDKTGIFRTALNAVTESIAQVLNREAIPRLMQVNGFRLEAMPEFRPLDVDAPDLGQLSQFMGSMAGMGMQWFPNADMEDFVRRVARLPELSPEDKDKVEIAGNRSEKTAFLQNQAAFIDAKMGLESRLQHILTRSEPGSPPVDPDSLAQAQGQDAAMQQGAEQQQQQDIAAQDPQVVAEQQQNGGQQ